MIIIEFDTISKEGIREAIKKHGGELISFTLEGPGGGNPCWMASFPSERQACALLKELGHLDQEEFETFIVEER